jgi:hypothetical protein
MRCARFRFFVLHEAFFAKQSKEKKSKKPTVDIDLVSLRSLEARLAVEYGHSTGMCP